MVSRNYRKGFKLVAKMKGDRLTKKLARVAETSSIENLSKIKVSAPIESLG